MLGRWQRAWGNSDRLAGHAPAAMLTLLVLLPMLWSIGYSLLYSVGAVGYFSQGWTLEHWKASLSAQGVFASLLLSASIALAVTSLTTSLALSMLLIAPKSRRQPWLLAGLCILLGTPSAVLAMLVYQFLSGGGLLARFAFHAGLIQTPSEFPSLVNDPGHVGIIIACTIGGLPLATLYFSELWDAVRIDSLCNLAQSLGATPTQARMRVALPMLLRRGRSMIILLFLFALGSFEAPLLLGRQSPQMISVFTQRHFGQFNLQEKPQAYVLATLYFLLCSALLVAYLHGRRRHVD